MERTTQVNWNSGEFYDALQSLLRRREDILSGLIDLQTLRTHVSNCTYINCLSAESGLVETFPISLQQGNISEEEWNRLKPMLLLVIDVAERNLQIGDRIES